jgi:hypothetical protein
VPSPDILAPLIDEVLPAAHSVQLADPFITDMTHMSEFIKKMVLEKF